MAFDPFTTPIDYFTVSGQRTPGIARIEGAGSPRKWDERVGYGLSGSFPVFLGSRLTKFQGSILLVTSEDWAAWYAWKRLVDRGPNGKRPRALDIWHPFLEGLDVKAANVEDCSQPTEVGETGMYMVRVDFLQHRAPKITLAKPEAAEPAKSADPVDALITKLTDQLGALAGG